jgi:hypothetical protein
MLNSTSCVGDKYGVPGTPEFFGAIQTRKGTFVSTQLQAEKEIGASLGHCYYLEIILINQWLGGESSAKCVTQR